MKNALALSATTALAMLFVGCVATPMQMAFRPSWMNDAVGSSISANKVSESKPSGDIHQVLARIKRGETLFATISNEIATAMGGSPFQEQSDGTTQTFTYSDATTQEYSVPIGEVVGDVFSLGISSLSRTNKQKKVRPITTLTVTVKNGVVTDYTLSTARMAQM